MPAVKCPVPDCQYETDNLDAVVVVALLTTHVLVHSAPVGAIVSAKIEKVKRPTVASAGSSEDWKYFVSRSKEYIQATKVSGKDLVIQLLECCDEILRRDITRSASGSLVDKSEQEVLAAMRTLAVREKNNMVARVSLHGMTQDRDETVRSFGARIRGQVSVCKFTLQCPGCEHSVDYTEAILRDVLTRGLNDPGIQLDLLGDKNQDMTLEQVFNSLKPRKPVSVLHYAFLIHKALKPPLVLTVEDEMPMLPKTRTNMITTRLNYVVTVEKRDMEKVLHPKPGRKNVLHTYILAKTIMNPYVEAIPVSQKSNKMKKLKVLYSILFVRCNTWVKRPSQPQPFINIVGKVVEDDYKQLGFQYSVVSQQRNTIIPAMADTACQSCLARIKVLHKIGLTKSDLIPVNMQMHAANNKSIVILGAVILGLSGKDQDNHELETRQIVYITDSSDKFFLSKEACITLGIISENFPCIDEIIGSVTDTSSQTNDENRFKTKVDCNCPKRQTPPPYQ
ncbi:unnamed protein product [Mytilus coruscus]|uniref:Uncharacterized protein n=1 Tax=Mytilus coruscus TaxID=42192 RepID=A0A6J7ZTY2_MYTCO|nr:unnamed protein product [Mytilus coruscus]